MDKHFETLDKKQGGLEHQTGLLKLFVKKRFNNDGVSKKSNLKHNKEIIN